MSQSTFEFLGSLLKKQCKFMHTACHSCVDYFTDVWFVSFSHRYHCWSWAGYEVCSWYRKGNGISSFFGATYSTPVFKKYTYHGEFVLRSWNVIIITETQKISTETKKISNSWDLHESSGRYLMYDQNEWTVCLMPQVHGKCTWLMDGKTPEQRLWWRRQ